jgi:hypothetical protein
VLSKSSSHRSARKIEPEIESKKSAIIRNTIPLRLLGFVTFCFALSLISLRASEPILTLAMVNYGSFPKHQFHAIRDRLGGAASRSVPIQASANLEKTLRPVTVELPLISAEVSGPQDKLEMANAPLLNRDLHSSKRASFWASFQPGYGDIFKDDSAALYGRTGTGVEEPGCGYLKIRFSF